MPIATRTFRVFVSSTFEDLKAERDTLQRDVFPKLRTLCEQHGARFQAIDLRWGVRDEAALDQQTMEICLREIRRCQATGVKPNFIVLLGDRYGWQPLPARIPATEWKALEPHLPALAEQWYRLDENAVPPEYCLQPRTAEFDWNPVEQELHEALAKAARAAGLPASALVKYEASATHQEILAADQEHVFAFVRPSTANTDPRVEELKSHLRVYPFDTAIVYDQLRQVIEAEVKRFEDRPALDLEVEAHDRFAEDRCRIFTGRHAALETIADYICGPERRPLVLHGESGSGKSAVMAKASQQYQGPGRLIRRFIGASPESASGHALLTSLCRQMAPGETPVDYAQLENAFKERLSAAAAEQPLVLFIDALDQLAASDPAREATWLPEELPPGVKVIVSTTDDVAGLRVQLEPMTQPEGGRALEEWLGEARRTLQPWQRETVLAHFERCGLPLYLKLAAEESKLWKSYTPQDACMLGEGVAGVIDTLFDRLASNANHGPVLAERSLGYLAAARYGLTEGEILDLLTADDTVWSDFDQRKHHDVSERRLPVVVWSRLSLDLEPYLTERAAPGGTVISFYHRQLAECAAVWSQDRHSDLARYFCGRPVSDTRRLVELVFQQRGAHQWREAEATLFDVRFLFAKVANGMVLDLNAEYQGLLQEAPKESLTRRRELGLIRDALRLSMHVVGPDPEQFPSQMVGRLHAYRDLPTVAHIVEELIIGAPRPWVRPLHACLDRPGAALLRTMEGHLFYINAVAVMPDGKRVVSAGDQTLKVWDLDTGRVLRTLDGRRGLLMGVAVTADGKRAVAASTDRILKVWDVDTGRALRTLEGHSAEVRGVAVTPDGKRAVSASWDKTLKVWDLDTGRVLLTLEGHCDRVDGVAVTGDGKRVVSASTDKTLKVWDLDSGREIRTLEGHLSSVRCVAVTPDGKQAVSASSDKTLKVWDLDTGLALRTLEESHSSYFASVEGVAVTPDGQRAISASQDHRLTVWELQTGRVLLTIAGHSANCVAVTPDGKRAVSGSGDGTLGTLKVWDLDTTRDLAILEGHSGPVQRVAATPDGKRAISASWDTTLKVWETETGNCLRTLEGHSGIVSSVAVTPDGKMAVSGSWDRTLKVWDLDTGGVLRTLEGHSGPVYGVAVTPDGKRVVSASGDKTLKVWDLVTGRALRKLKAHSDVFDVAVTPDGKRAVSASFDHTADVWNLETGRALRTLKGHTYVVTSVAVTPDGTLAVSASDDKTMRVWDLAKGRNLRTLEGHLAGVRGVAAMPDGKRVVSASADHTIKVWDVDTGVPIATFRCNDPADCCACAAPNLLLAGDVLGRVYFLSFEAEATRSRQRSTPAPVSPLRQITLALRRLWPPRARNQDVRPP